MTTNKATEGETQGAWIVHHGEKVVLDANGAAEFPAIEQAAKAASLLTKLAASDDSLLTPQEVEGVAKAARLNPKRELQTYLDTLEQKRLVQREGANLRVLGITGRATLRYASVFYNEAEPTKAEAAAIDIAERTSEAPAEESVLSEYVSDTYKFTKSDSQDLLLRYQGIGFVDGEGDAGNRLIFNGNLFRRGTLAKTTRVLNSLSSDEQRKMTEFGETLKSYGCVTVATAVRILTANLFDKLKAAGVYDLNTVSNPLGDHVFVTSPGAFHKFTDPLVDDAFDMAKSLVAALTYGMTQRSSSLGRIQRLDALLSKLISGQTVGPATAIGQDYRVLEQNRVIQIIPATGNMFRMRLLKKEVGELALQVLIRGDANATVLNAPPGAPMTGFAGPDPSRWAFRRQQSKPSRRHTEDVLSALRGGGAF